MSTLMAYKGLGSVTVQATTTEVEVELSLFKVLPTFLILSIDQNRGVAYSFSPGVVAPPPNPSGTPAAADNFVVQGQPWPISVPLDAASIYLKTDQGSADVFIQGIEPQLVG